MSKEARLAGGMQIRKTVNGINVIDHRPAFSGFTADVDGAAGPSPGSINVGPNGTNVSFAQLTEPGWCEIYNMDDAQTVQWGLWDPNTTTFYPLGELEPGHGIVYKFSRNFGERHDEGVGTGTPGTGQVMLRFYSGGVDFVVVYIGAFER